MEYKNLYKKASEKVIIILTLTSILILNGFLIGCQRKVKAVNTALINENEDPSEKKIIVEQDINKIVFKDKAFEKMFCDYVGVEPEYLNVKHIKDINNLTIIGDEIFITDSEYNELTYYNSKYYYIYGEKYESKGSIKSLEDLSMFRSLEKATIIFNQVENINGVEKLPNLKYLNVSCNNITNIESAKGAGNLEKIILSGNNIDLMDENYIETCKYLMDNTCVVMNMNFLKQVISAGETHSLAIDTDGKILVCGRDTNNNKTKITDWENIVDVAAGKNHSVALKPNGTVIAQGSNKRYGQCEVGDLKNVINIEAGGASTAALKQDGTAESVGQTDFGQDYYIRSGVYVDIECGDITNAAVTGYGKAAAEGYYANRIIEQWDYIVQVESGYNEYYARTVDGKVLTTKGQELDWDNIIDIAAGENYIAGLKNDGTVKILAKSEKTTQEVSVWNGIIAIYGGRNHIIGLKQDGTAVSAGDNSQWQANTNTWKNIMTY